MTAGDQREPLWASSLADQPRAPYEDVAVVVEYHDDKTEKQQQPPKPPEPPAQPRPVEWRIGVVSAIVVLLLLVALGGTGTLEVKDVPSGWGDVKMTCRTARVDDGVRAVEWFTCHATDGQSLPAGTYRTPDSQWTSDITRRNAIANEIEISPEGEVDGWAAY